MSNNTIRQFSDIRWDSHKIPANNPHNRRRLEQAKYNAFSSPELDEFWEGWQKAEEWIFSKNDKLNFLNNGSKLAIYFYTGESYETICNVKSMISNLHRHSTPNSMETTAR